MTELPDGWHSKTLSEVCDLITDGSHFSPKTQDSGYPYITVRDLSEKGINFANCKFISQESFDELEKNGCRPKAGDVLFSKDGTVGKVAQVSDDTKFVVLSSLAILRPNTDFLTSEFLKYALKSPVLLENALGMKTGTALRRVVLRNLKTLEIPIPPIDEQHKIVVLLEDHLSRLDAALADVKQVKIKAAQFRRSLLQAAFTGKLDSAGTQLMDEWKTKKVGELADTQLGKMLNKSKQTGENTIPYLRSINVQWGRVDISDLNQMDILPNELEKFTVKKGDLLICEGGESGRVAIWDKDEPIGFQNALHRVRSKNEVINKFLYYYFEWLVKNKLIEHLFNGVTIKHFPQENLRSVEMSYPPIGEQYKIVALLEDHLSRLEASVSLADAMERQSNGLRRSLLQAAFTGQLTNEVVSV
jgi:type I restriction enzyme S subunit